MLHLYVEIRLDLDTGNGLRTFSFGWDGLVCAFVEEICFACEMSP